MSDFQDSDKEFLLIPSDSWNYIDAESLGIRRSSLQFPAIPSGFGMDSYHGRSDFDRLRNRWELDFCRIHLVIRIRLEFRELEGIDSRVELIPAMFNIAE